MKIIFNTLKEATDFMKVANKNLNVDCHFETVKGEVHVIMEEKKITIIK